MRLTAALLVVFLPAIANACGNWECRICLREAMAVRSAEKTVERYQNVLESLERRLERQVYFRDAALQKLTAQETGYVATLERARADYADALEQYLIQNPTCNATCGQYLTLAERFNRKICNMEISLERFRQRANSQIGRMNLYISRMEERITEAENTLGLARNYLAHVLEEYRECRDWNEYICGC